MCIVAVSLFQEPTARFCCHLFGLRARSVGQGQTLSLPLYVVCSLDLPKPKSEQIILGIGIISSAAAERVASTTALLVQMRCLGGVVSLSARERGGVNTLVCSTDPPHGGRYQAESLTQAN